MNIQDRAIDVLEGLLKQVQRDKLKVVSLEVFESKHKAPPSHTVTIELVDNFDTEDIEL